MSSYMRQLVPYSCHAYVRTGTGPVALINSN